jgi:DnaJ-class molecular chaperone
MKEKWFMTDRDAHGNMIIYVGNRCWCFPFWSICPFCHGRLRERWDTDECPFCQDEGWMSPFQIVRYYAWWHTVRHVRNALAWLKFTLHFYRNCPRCHGQGYVRGTDGSIEDCPLSDDYGMVSIYRLLWWKWQHRGGGAA